MRQRFKKHEGSMKNNARLYLPWPLVSAFASSMIAARRRRGSTLGNTLLHLSNDSTAGACCIGC
jgi:hypothetical protein